MKKKILFWFVFPLLVVLAGAAGYIVKEYNRKLKDTAKLKPQFTLEATALVADFDKDEQGSNTRYLDKVILLSGTVKELARDDKGFYTVVLGDTASLSSVRCSMDSTHNAGAAGLKPGSTVRMKGICSGYNKDELLGSDVILVRSVVDANQ